MTKRLLTTLLIIASVLLPVSLLMFYLEATCIDILPQKCLIQLTSLSVLYFSYATVVLSTFEKLVKTQSKFLTAFHLVNSVIRFLISIFAILIYYLIYQTQDLLVFIFNLIVFYIIIMVVTNIHFIKAEKVDKKQKQL